MRLQTSAAGHFRPVGSQSFGAKRVPPRAFDQQPLEAAASIAACLAAWHADGDPAWRAEAARAFAWFLGSNDLSSPLVDVETGSCRDGLHPDRANENRGGESAVSYLLSLAQMRELARLSDERAKACTESGRQRLTNPPRNPLSAHARKPSSASVASGSRASCPAPLQASDRASGAQAEPTDGARITSSIACWRSIRRSPRANWQRCSRTFRIAIATCLTAFEARAEDMDDVFTAHASFSRTQRQLVGAYFLHEYSFEAAALFNPSIVAHPDQTGAPKGALRFILSLRAVGEGHVSSLTFRSGFIAADGKVAMDPTARLASIPYVQQHEPGAPADYIDLMFKSEE